MRQMVPMDHYPTTRQISPMSRTASMPVFRFIALSNLSVSKTSPLRQIRASWVTVSPKITASTNKPSINDKSPDIKKCQGFSILCISQIQCGIWKSRLRCHVYPLKKFEIKFEIPDKPDRDKIDRIIFKELVNGIFPEKSRLYFNEVINELRQTGCDAVVFGCTEIPLLVNPDDCPLPTLDSTRLLARAALQEAIEK